MFRRVICNSFNLRNSLKLNNSVKLNNGLINYSTSTSSEFSSSRKEYRNQEKKEVFKTVTKVKTQEDIIKEKNSIYLDNKIKDIKESSSIEEKIEHYNKILKKFQENEYYDQADKLGEVVKLLLEHDKIEEAKALLKRIIDNKMQDIQSGKIKSNLVGKKEIQCLKAFLYYYLNKSQFEELEQFIHSNAATYKPFFELKYEFKAFLTNLSTLSFKKFSDLVYSLYSNNLVTVESSINILIFSLDYDKTSNTFSSFYEYHKGCWGPFNVSNFSDILPSILFKKHDKLLIQIINNMIENGISFKSLNEKFIHHMIRLIYRVQREDQTQFTNSIDKILHIATQQKTHSLSNLLFFYSSFYDCMEVAKEERINQDTLSIVNNSLLNRLSDEDKLKVINNLILLLLASNQYHKALFWYTSISNNFRLSPNVFSAYYFSVYHKELLDVEEKQLHREGFNFWEPIISSLSETKLQLRSNFRDYQRDYPGILDKFNISSSISKGIEMKILVQKELNRINTTDEQLINLLKENKESNQLGVEIYNYLYEHYLNFNDIPKGTLLFETILAIKNDPSNIISKLENIPHPIIKVLLNSNKADISYAELKSIYNDELINQFINGPEENNENELVVSNFKKLLFNMFYYRFNTKMAVIGFINLIERKIPIGYDLLDQAVHMISENKGYFDREIIKMPVVYSFIHKFTKKNNTYEDGFHLTLRALIDQRKFEMARDLLNDESFASFKYLKNTLLEKSRLILESQSNQQQLVLELSNFLNDVLSNGYYKNVSFLLIPIIINLLPRVSIRSFEKFEHLVLLNQSFSESLRFIDNVTLSKLISLKKPISLSSPYISLCMGPYIANEVKFNLKKVKVLDESSILSVLNRFRSLKSGNTRMLYNSIKIGQ